MNIKTQWLVSAAWLLGAACQRTPGPPGAADCIDPGQVNPQGICPMDYNPVCGCDGRTYANACAAGNAGVRTYSAGPCAESLPKPPAGQ